MSASLLQQRSVATVVFLATLTSLACTSSPTTETKQKQDTKQDAQPEGDAKLNSGSMQKSTRTPFTEDIRTKFGLSNDDLKKVQFYVAGNMTLTHAIKEGDKREIVGGKLVSKDGVEVHQRDIPKDTPTVCVAASGDGNSRVLRLDFGTQDALLDFSPEADGKFYVNGTSNGSEYKVKFANKDREYKLLSSERSGAYLVVDTEAINKSVTNKIVLPGTKLPGSK